MNPVFAVRTTTSFERAFRKLARHHPDLVRCYGQSITLLAVDPYNRSNASPIRKLENVPQGEGQWRLRINRFRFRYDIEGQTVWLKACSLRREDTYR